MQREKPEVRDPVTVAGGYRRDDVDGNERQPNVHWVLRDEETGEVKAEGWTHNLITDVGDQWVIESAHGIGTPNALTGMRLGTGSTTPAKSGAGAAIVTYVSGSAQEFDTGPSGSSNGAGAGYDAAYSVTWEAGEATADGIAECVITNETPLTDVAGSTANTIARFLLTPTVNKGASDSLTITWTHRHNGS